MTDAEVREVVADLTDETPTVMPDGRMRNVRGPQWRPAGVHRRGTICDAKSWGPGATVFAGVMELGRLIADVHWYETVQEMFAMSAA